MSEKLNSKIIVNLTALRNNIEVLTHGLDTDTGIMAVIKADAYGHGAVRLAEYLQPIVDSFAVNDINEGIELRNNGVTKPILVFGVPEEQFVQQYRIHNLTATISDEKHFELLPPGTSYHLNFDTGMGRLGFLPEDAPKIADLIEQRKELVCTGIYSHFATSDITGSDKVAGQQKLFQTVLEYFPSDLSAHICNTGGTVFYDLNKFQTVRLGIGMYGYAPGVESIEGLQPVLSWSTRLVQVKKRDTGTTISYGATWQIPSEGYVGVIPVGYDDGLRRNLSGQLKVKIGTTLYDVVGRITMNYSMVYLGDKYYPEGTEVELINDAELTAAAWAKKLNTIPYEILTGISPNIPRTYV